jgi:hypothetical protein
VGPPGSAMNGDHGHTPHLREGLVTLIPALARCVGRGWCITGSAVAIADVVRFDNPRSIFGRGLQQAA